MMNRREFLKKTGHLMAGLYAAGSVASLVNCKPSDKKIGPVNTKLSEAVYAARYDDTPMFYEPREDSGMIYTMKKGQVMKPFEKYGEWQYIILPDYTNGWVDINNIFSFNDYRDNYNFYAPRNWVVVGEVKDDEKMLALRLGQENYDTKGRYIKIIVYADRCMQNTGIFLNEGQEFEVSAKGNWSCDTNELDTYYGPEGCPLPWKSGHKEFGNTQKPFGCLVGRIGRPPYGMHAARPDYIYIGKNYRGVADSDGFLYLGPNDHYEHSQYGDFIHGNLLKYIKRHYKKPSGVKIGAFDVEAFAYGPSVNNVIFEMSRINRYSLKKDKYFEDQMFTCMEYYFYRYCRGQ
jgi:hypothetical protein